MKYFATFLRMKDAEKSQQFRPEHLAYLEVIRSEGKLFANGPFVDGSGGLVIYSVPSYEEAEACAQADPLVLNGAREYEIHEWKMVAS